MIRNLTLIMIAAAAGALAQSPCTDGNHWNNDRANHCEIREYTVADTGKFDADAGRNGGIRVFGADRSNVLVKAKVQTQAQTDYEAKSLATQVSVQAVAGSVRVNGPENLRDQGWAVSYEIYVPRRSALELKAHNGGINITDVEGAIQFETTNGGVKLKKVGGDVRGKTKNGGVDLELAGNTWRGNQLDVETTNGGIKLAVPESFSARVEASTVNGGVHTDFPNANLIKDRNNRNVSVTIGSGGPLVKLTTVNGGIHVNKT